MRLLLVEDMPAEAKIIRRMLMTCGHEVSVAGCLKEARTAIATGGFDAAVVDVHLPNGDGRHLVEEHPNLPIILVSGSPESEDVLDKIELVSAAMKFKKDIMDHISYAKKGLGIS